MVYIKNKAYKIINKIFSPTLPYHTKLNDLFYRIELKNKTFNKPIFIPGEFGKMNIYDNLFDTKGKLNLHYVTFSERGIPYFVFDSVSSSLISLFSLENIPVGERFLPNLINENSDLYFKFENMPRYLVLRKLNTTLFYLEDKINALQERIRMNDKDYKAIGELKESQDVYTVFKQTEQDMEENISATSIKFNIGFRKKYINTDFKNVIEPEYNAFYHEIQQSGHRIKRNINQQFAMYDYMNTEDMANHFYLIEPYNMAYGNLYPFVFPTFSSTPKIIMGNYLDTGMPILKDIWDLDSQNGIIIGQMGSGKSATSKAFLTRNLIFKNRKIVVIDPQPNEYLYVTKMIGGEYINILQTSDKNNFSLNIFDKAEYDIEDKGTGTAFSLKVNDVAEFIRLTVTTGKTNELKDNPIYNQFLTSLIMSYYNKEGIYGIQDLNDNSEATLDGFIKYVDELSSEFKSSGKIKMFNKEYIQSDLNFDNYRQALALIASACETLKLPEYKIFMGKTNIDLSGRFIVFNTAGLPEKLQILTTYVIMNYVIKTMSSALSEDKIFLIDEGWKILSMLGSEYIKVIAKTARKFRLGLTITTQQITDFASEEGRALVENSQFAYLYRVQGDKSVMETLKQLFNLTDDDIDFLKTAGSSKTSSDKSARGILKFKDENYRIKYILTEDELKFSESNQDKLSEMIPKEILDNRKKIKFIDSEIEARKNQKLNTDYEEKELTYLSGLVDTLRDIKANIERNSIEASDYNEENIRDFVMDNFSVYSLNTNGKKNFGEGINRDEISYLMKNGYREVQADEELEKLFGPEIFYLKSLKNEDILIYNNFLINKIKEKYKDKLIGDIMQEQNDIILRIKDSKKNERFYVYHPDSDVAELWTIENSKLKIEPSPKQAYFESRAINPDFIYIKSLDTNQEIVYSKEQEALIKDKMQYVEKKIQIRTILNYFTPFLEQPSTMKTSQYYVLFTEAYNEKTGNSKIPVIEKNIFLFTLYESLLKEIFGF